jgi:hypothetical protein
MPRRRFFCAAQNDICDLASILVVIQGHDGM